LTQQGVGRKIKAGRTRPAKKRAEIRRFDPARRRQEYKGPAKKRRTPPTALTQQDVGRNIKAGSNGPKYAVFSLVLA